MPDIKSNKFNKGWYFRQQHLVGLDGFTDVNNFVIYENAIEKVRGWKKLILRPFKFSDAPDTINIIIDNVSLLIDELNDSFYDPNTLVPITYPLAGPEVLSIFEYLKFQEEEIHLGNLGFDPIQFFNVPRQFNYNFDFRGNPINDINECDNTAYGLFWTCDIVNCIFPSANVTYSSNPCNILAGPAIAIHPPFNRDFATLYGLIYDSVNTQLVLAKWINQSLITYGEILGIHDVTLSNRDVFEIASSESGISAKLNNVEVIGPINDTDISLDGCIGAIIIPQQ